MTNKRYRQVDETLGITKAHACKSAERAWRRLKGLIAEEIRLSDKSYRHDEQLMEVADCLAAVPVSDGLKRYMDGLSISCPKLDAPAAAIYRRSLYCLYGPAVLVWDTREIYSG